MAGKHTRSSTGPEFRGRVSLSGVLGRAVDASRTGRLSHFIVGPDSQAVAIFSKEVASGNFSGDWNGEHVGKWLYSAARASFQTGDQELRSRVLAVADFLVECQEPDGYLGTYAPTSTARMTSDSIAMPTWDVWVHAYVILGLLEVNQFFPDDRYVQAAARAGDICWEVIAGRGRSIVELGSHDGLSATPLIEPAVELARVTGEQRYLQLAQAIIDQIESRSSLGLVARSLSGVDLQLLGDGKIYQLLWTFVGLAKFASLTGQPIYLRAAEHAWQSVVDNHLTPGGGPWGGNRPALVRGIQPRGVLQPLRHRRNLQHDGLDPSKSRTPRGNRREQVRRRARKVPLQRPIGGRGARRRRLAYFTFPNGMRSYADYWDCCKSSGALALEEIAPMMFSEREGGIACNLFGDASGRLATSAGDVRIDVQTDYPGTHEVRITIDPVDPAPSQPWPLWLRIPAWAAYPTLVVNGQEEQAAPGSYAKLERSWQSGDELVLSLPMEPRVVRRAYSVSHNDREITRSDYMALACGPISYATGLIGGYRSEATIMMPSAHPELAFDIQPGLSAQGFQRFVLKRPGYARISFEPYMAAGGYASGSWRSTWISTRWEAG